MDRSLLSRAFELAADWLERLPDRPAGARAGREELLAALGGPLPERGEEPVAALEKFARAMDPGLVASAGPRYFGFVTGAGLPAAMAADWLTTAWNQNVAPPTEVTTHPCGVLPDSSNSRSTPGAVHQPRSVVTSLRPTSLHRWRSTPYSRCCATPTVQSPSSLATTHGLKSSLW